MPLAESSLKINFIQIIVTTTQFLINSWSCLLQEFFQDNSNQRNQMALEFFGNSSRILQVQCDQQLNF